MSRTRAALVTVACLAVAWFVATRPLVAVALVLGTLCIVGFVSVVGGIALWLLTWRVAPSTQTGVVDLEAIADVIVDPIEGDDPRLPYGGGWGS